MEAINKNKEEIEKINEEIKKEVDLIRSYLLEGERHQRIKTSILWCEAIKQITKKYEHLQLQPLVQELKEFETHLTWLKEQEKE